LGGVEVADLPAQPAGRGEHGVRLGCRGQVAHLEQVARRRARDDALRLELPVARGRPRVVPDVAGGALRGVGDDQVRRDRLDHDRAGQVVVGVVHLRLGRAAVGPDDQIGRPRGPRGGDGHRQRRYVLALGTERRDRLRQRPQQHVA